MGLIYCITNTKNGKQYVGQTTCSVKARWQHHVKNARNLCLQPLYCAIRKYGEDAFVVKQIGAAESLDELNRKEIFYIAELSTLAPRGYNLEGGGRSRTGYICSEETRQKLSEAFTGYRHTEQARLNMRLAKKKKRRFTSRGPQKEETCRKISETKKEKMGRSYSAETIPRILENYAAIFSAN